MKSIFNRWLAPQQVARRSWSLARNLLGGALLLASAQADTAMDAALRTDTAELVRHGHRLSGTDALNKSADYVAQRLKAIGIENVVDQTFRSQQTFIKRCQVELLDEKGEVVKVLPLLPARPNGMIPPVTPPEGIEGEVIFGGDGSVERFRKSPENKIVVLDYNSGNNFRRVFRLGAKAVIFTPNAQMDSSHEHHSLNDANIPRFYYNGPADDMEGYAGARIFSEVIWRPTVGRNVIAHIPGRDPKFYFEAEETMVLATHLDSFGEIPRKTPAARAAANVAALLQLAEDFQKNPPRRNIVLAFLDNQSRGHLGAVALYRSTLPDNEEGAIVKDLKSVNNEEKYVRTLLEGVTSEEPLAESFSERRELRQLIRDIVDEIFYYVKEEQADLRLELRELVNIKTTELDDKLAELQVQVEANPNQETEALIARLVEIKERFEVLVKDRQDWNDFRYALSEYQLDEKLKEKNDYVIKRLKADLDIRLNDVIQARQNLDRSKEVAAMLGDRRNIVLHTSLVLGDSNPRWGLVTGGHGEFMRSPEDSFGLYTSVEAAVHRTYEALSDSDKETAAFDPISVDGSIAPSIMFFSGRGLTHSGAIAGYHGVYNLAMVTAQDAMQREGTPSDTVDAFNFKNFAQQLEGAKLMLREMADSEGLSQKQGIRAHYRYYSKSFSATGKTKGPNAKTTPLGSAVRSKPIQGGVARIHPKEDLTNKIRERAGFEEQIKFIPAHDDMLLVPTDQQGFFSYGPVDPELKKIQSRIFGFDERGMLEFASDEQSSRSSPQKKTNLFAAYHGAIMAPPQLLPDKLSIYDASTNSLMPLNRSRSRFFDGVISWFAHDRVDDVKIFGKESSFMLNIEALNEGEEPPGINDVKSYGVGFQHHNILNTFPVATRNAQDILAINTLRLDKLRSRGVTNSSIEEMHGKNNDAFEEILAETDISKHEAESTAVYLKERTVYDDTRNSIEDLVLAIIFLLVLTIPFAFALERLLIGASNIYRQVGWFVGFFSLTFLILYFTHPAFAISATPIIIFLGFAIILLASLVIFVIMQKFEVELKTLQGMESTVHSADVSRLNTILAAMNMGISTMRRRPLRTALSAITIILLTFTILCFASFGSKLGVNTYFDEPLPQYSGVFMHRLTWRTINEDFVDVAKGKWGEEHTVTTRYWRVPELFIGNTGNVGSSSVNPGFVISNQDVSKSVSMRGMLGLEAAELEHRTKLAEAMGGIPDSFEDTVWITETVGRQLGVKPGDKVQVAGRVMRLGPLLESSRLVNLTEMDGAAVFPVDLASGVDPNTAAQETESDDQSWTTMPVDSVVIAPTSLVKAAGGTLRAIHIYTDSVQEAGEVGDELAIMSRLPLSATRSDGVYTHIFGNQLEASGIKDLFFPVLLGGLVIFGTMLGSVADREKEIYTFSALGLAPPHVAGLFFSEAMVYSVIGGMGGYLFAQFALMFLNFLASFGLLTVPDMNYSSTNAIITIFIVMATVLLSSIYPAMKASRSANPGVMRNWRLPQPDGDELSMVFPFTVSEYDITGVVSFLKEHFDNFQDVGMGCFMSSDCEYFFPEGTSVGLKSRLALSPFDLGVSQDFELFSAPSKIPGIDEVNIRLRRISGQPKDWYRLNKTLMDDLRKQFLIWRSIPPETVEEYRMKTLTWMARIEAEKTASEDVATVTT